MVPLIIDHAIWQSPESYAHACLIHMRSQDDSDLIGMVMSDPLATMMDHLNKIETVLMHQFKVRRDEAAKMIYQDDAVSWMYDVSPDNNPEMVELWRAWDVITTNADVGLIDRSYRVRRGQMVYNLAISIAQLRQSCRGKGYDKYIAALREALEPYDRMIYGSDPVSLRQIIGSLREMMRPAEIDESHVTDMDIVDVMTSDGKHTLAVAKNGKVLYVLGGCDASPQNKTDLSLILHTSLLQFVTKPEAARAAYAIKRICKG